MDAASIYHLRLQAMIDFGDGKLPEAEKQLNKLITEIGSPQGDFRSENNTSEWYGYFGRYCLSR